MKNTINSANVTKFDLINAETSDSFKSIVGEDFKEIRACAIVEDVDRESGEMKEFSYIFTTEGDVYGGNSESVKRACDNVIELLTDGERIKFRVKSAKTNNGREFLSLLVAPVADNGYSDTDSVNLGDTDNVNLGDTDSGNLGNIKEVANEYYKTKH